MLLTLKFSTSQQLQMLRKNI